MNRNDATNTPRAASHRQRRCLLVAALVLPFVLLPRLAPGSPEDQRARLPEAPEQAACTDPVAGTWRAHVFFAHVRIWHIFDLKVRRVEGNATALTGTIRTHKWDGGPQDVEKAPCLGGNHILVEMDAEGSYLDGRVDFRGLNWRLVERYCGTVGGYNPDRFAGRVDAESQEFESTYNDGGVMQNQTVVFRRIDCFSKGPGPRRDLPPPTPRSKSKESIFGCQSG